MTKHQWARLAQWRLRHNTAPVDILAADETQPIDPLLCLFTTGLDPVVHADSVQTRRRSMDCRIKSGNDGREKHYSAGLAAAAAAARSAAARFSTIRTDQTEPS